MPEQLAFPLPIRTSLERGDYFVSSANALAVARLDDVAGWSNGKIVLVGPEGAGKTHLAHVWAETQDGVLIDLEDLAAADVIDITSAVAVELPENLSAQAEQTLFHLHNHMISAKLALLLIARTPPSRWTIALPDLKSRMQATDIVQISSPDDALLSAVLIKLFSDRQLRVSPSLIDWLTKRMDRSFAEAQRLVAEIDEAALASGTGVTRTLAQRALDNAPNCAP